MPGGRRPPAREASMPAPQGPRRRAAERLELLVTYKGVVVPKQGIVLAVSPLQVLFVPENSLILLHYFCGILDGDIKLLFPRASVQRQTFYDL